MLGKIKTREELCAEEIQAGTITLADLEEKIKSGLNCDSRHIKTVLQYAEPDCVRPLEIPVDIKLLIYKEIVCAVAKDKFNFTSLLRMESYLKRIKELDSANLTINTASVINSGQLALYYLHNPARGSSSEAILRAIDLLKRYGAKDLVDLPSSEMQIDRVLGLVVDDNIKPKVAQMQQSVYRLGGTMFNQSSPQGREKVSSELTAAEECNQDVSLASGLEL